MTALDRLRDYAEEARTRGHEGAALLDHLLSTGRLQPVSCPECDGDGCAACDGYGAVFAVGDDG